VADLSLEARAFVRAGRLDGPTDADRGRVLDALRVRLGGDLLLGGAVVSPALAATARPAVSSMTKALAALGVVVLGAIGGFLALRSTPEPTEFFSKLPSNPVVAPDRFGAIESEMSGASATRALALTSPSSAIRPEDRQPPPRLAPDGLSKELAILSRAEAELNRGHTESALRSLDKHEREFPKGIMTQERTTARIQALCALGRTAEANAELAQLARLSPQSPHEARARQACRDRAGQTR
jgi:hypothetical protein